MPALLSNKAIALLFYYLDGILSLTTILIGRLLPKLKIPPTDLTNKVCIITGANAGIGYSLALSLASQNATVYLACRNASKAQEAASSIIDATGISSAKIHVLSLDTSSLASIRAFASTWDSSSKPINQPTSSSTTQASPARLLRSTHHPRRPRNHLRHQLRRLFPAHLPPRNTPLAFSTHDLHFQHGAVRRPTAPDLHSTPSRPERRHEAYGRSNASTPCHASASAHRTAHTIIPGYTSTPIFEKMPTQPWYKDPFFWALKACTAICIPVDEGAATGLWLATTDDERIVGEGKGGECWDRCVRRSTAADVLSEKTLARMWEQWEIDAGAEWA
ncbi:hypothetical protein MBLNU13_g07394t1 [Cladosporium sp. NU13]